MLLLSDGCVQAAGNRPIQEVQAGPTVSAEKLRRILGDGGERGGETRGGLNRCLELLFPVTFILKIRANNSGFALQDLLVTVFENGCLMQDYTLEEIRKNARLQDDEPNPVSHNQERVNQRIINGVH